LDKEDNKDRLTDRVESYRTLKREDTVNSHQSIYYDKEFEMLRE